MLLIFIERHLRLTMMRFGGEEKHIIDHGMMVLCIYISSSCLYLSLLHGGVISAGSLLMQVDVAVSIK